MGSRAFIAALVLAGCGTHKPVVHPDGGGPEFVAVQGDFADFESWEAFDGGMDAPDSLDGGQRTIYLNERPPHGSRSFPLGTIIVKTTEGAQTFAMAKRGHNFNPFADDWEWFELAPIVDGGVQIVWRGLGPNGTLAYGDMPATGCNGCHIAGFQNDFVGGAAIQLSSF